MTAYVSGYIFNTNDIGELVIDAVEKLMEERDSQLGLEENQHEELQARYDDLYNELTSKYLGSCDRNMNTNIIEVDVSSGLFDYDKYHFYGVDITEMKLSKIVKKYSSNFYCEWKNCNTQIISIDFNNIYKKLK